MNLQRNDLIILAVLVLVALAGYATRHYQLNRLEQLQQNFVQLSSERERNLQLAGLVLDPEARERQASWMAPPKKLLPLQEPDFSYRFVKKLARQSGMSSAYNFSPGQRRTQGEVEFFQFALSGESSFIALSRFLENLARSQVLYKVSQLRVAKSNSAGASVRYALRLESHGRVDSIKLRSVKPSFAGKASSLPNYNIFAVPTPPRPKRRNTRKPVVKKPVPDKLVLDGARLLALVFQQAHIRDAKGKNWTLIAGAEIHKGRLIRIDQQNSQAIFAMQQNGEQVLRTLKLKLD